MWKLGFYLLLLGSIAAERVTVPVVILDNEKLLKNINVEPNPFAKIKSTDFVKILDEAKKLSETVIIFVEETFCAEDLRLKDNFGTSYFHLNKSLREDHAKYLPAVSQPYNTLKLRFPIADFNSFYMTEKSSKIDIYDRKLKHLYVFFKDGKNESRISTLRRHDLAIREVFIVMRQIATRPIVAFYTGKANVIALDKMNFKSIKTYPSQRQPGVTISSSGALFRFIGVYSTIGSRRSMFSQIPLVAEETWLPNQLITRMAYTDFELQFSFDFKKDRWIVESVSLIEWDEEVGRTELGFGAPWEWSYTCSEPIVLVNLRDGSSLTISHYQIQPFRSGGKVICPQKREADKGDGEADKGDGEADKGDGEAVKGDGEAVKGDGEADKIDIGINNQIKNTNSSDGNTNRCFGPAVNCGPYFNAHILSGLLVTAFCLGILTYGVISLYNCHANDRYDDAHAKPLVIAVEGGQG